MIKCKVCGATNHALKRVNPQGVTPAEWKCVDCFEVVKGDKELFKGMDLKASYVFQLEEWVAGRPHHNPVANVCCPDFSCCAPDMIMDKDVRVKFREAHLAGDDQVTMAIMGMALSGLTTKAQYEGLEVHVIADPDTDARRDN